MIMTKIYFNITGTDAQLKEFQRIIQTFKLKYKVLVTRTFVTGFVENIGIEVEGKSEEITKLKNHLNNKEDNG